MRNTIQEADPPSFELLSEGFFEEKLRAALREVLEEGEFKVFLVGGPVRDLLLGMPLKDVDFVVEGDARSFAELLAKRLSGRIKAVSQFLTYKLEYEGGELDVATARKEVYPEPAALPKVFPATLLEDLSRRDFTVNAMAIPLKTSGRAALIDPFGGRYDLKKGLVRVLHEESFVDDPTRIFRAARYAVRFGFELAPETLRALKKGFESGAVSKLSPARIYNELGRILKESRPLEVINRLIELKVFEALGVESLKPFSEAELPKDFDFKKRTKGLVLALAGGEVETAVRLGLSPTEAARLSKEFCKMLQLRSFRPKSPSHLYRTFKDFSDEVLFAAFLRFPELRGFIKNFLELRGIRPELSGDDLKRLFRIPPSPLLGKVLKELLYAKLDGKVKDRHEEVEFVKSLLESLGK